TSHTLPSYTRVDSKISTSRRSSRSDAGETGEADAAASVSIAPACGAPGSPILDVEQLARTVTLDRGADETAEQRVRVGRTRAQLGVRLRRDVERVHVPRQLDVLDEVAAGPGSREHE